MQKELTFKHAFQQTPLAAVNERNCLTKQSHYMYYQLCYTMVI